MIKKNIHKITNMIKRYKNDRKVQKNGYGIKIGKRANSCKFMQVCWRGMALYAAMLLRSLYKFVRRGPLLIAAC
jgi:hypothetical protein